ncbi:unnamed protein product [Lactuca saligna]|uniref:Uncharacterized protein n=1 Tax=Lactuca saligna TaxID=75948 RepID=A0AA35UUF5_LACSI|nr:unnamed protein product [Lactuca saligna]
MDAPSINIDKDDYFSNHTSAHFTQQPPFVASPSAVSPSGNPNKRAKPSTLRPRVHSASLDPPLCASPKASITTDDLEKLELLELGPVDPLRFVVYHIFGGTMNIREIWVICPMIQRY